MNKWLILSFLLVTSPTIIGVNTPIFNVSIEESYLSGTATYETGGTFSDSEGTEEFWFPISVLDFPINNIGGTLQFGVDYNLFSLTYSYSSYFNNVAGDLIDSDYGITIDGEIVNSDTLTIYSTSTSSTDISKHQLELLYTILTKGTTIFNVGVGYVSERYYFEAKDNTQTYPNNPEIEATITEGPVLTYELIYNMPLFFIELITSINSFDFVLKYGVSTLASSHEVDDHLLRDRLAEGDGEGTIVSFESEVVYNINNKSSLFMGYTYTNVAVDGIYENTFYNGSSLEPFFIDFVSHSTQHGVGVGYHYEF
jgi:hypothetical protein